jgi:DNA-binding transcriptional regulator YdaS (Cro superfamily)
MTKEIALSRRRELAQLHCINDDWLYQCLTGRRDMDPVKALELESATNGEITRFMVCQTRGRLIWPELATTTDTTTTEGQGA